MALGADRMNVLRLVLRGAFLQIAVGLAIGVPATILAGYAMTTQLFGVRPYAPDMLADHSHVQVLALQLLVATLLPARRCRCPRAHSRAANRVVGSFADAYWLGCRRADLLDRRFHTAIGRTGLRRSCDRRDCGTCVR